MAKKVDITNSNSLYIVEYSSTSDSTCKGFNCDGHYIQSGVLRIGKLTKSKYGSMKYETEEKMAAKWYHVHCMFDEFLKARPSTHVITSPNDFRCGWNSLKEEDKKMIEEKMKSLQKAREETKTSKRKNKKEKEEEEEEDGTQDEKPRKKKVKPNAKKAPVHRASESLVQAVFPCAVWERVLRFSVYKDIMQLRKTSKIMFEAAKTVLNREGLKVKRSSLSPPPSSLANNTRKITIKGTPDLSWTPLFRNLTSLNVKSCSDKDTIGDNLVQLTNLTDLSLVWLPKYSYIPKLTSLRSLYVQGYQNHEDLSGYAKLTALTSLSIPKAFNTTSQPLDPVLEWVSLINLTILKIPYTCVNEQWMPIFEKLPNLSYLKFMIPLEATFLAESVKNTFDFSKFSNLKKISVMQLPNWAAVILPPSLVTYKAYLQWTQDAGSLPPFPATFRNFFVDSSFYYSPATWMDELVSLNSEVRVDLKIGVGVFGNMSENAQARLSSVTLTQYNWPKSSEFLNSLENLNGLKILPPRIICNFTLTSCSYKTKVRTAIQKLRKKANILIYLEK